MFDSILTEPALVFLNIPKTVGQTVHNTLARAVTKEKVSPVRLRAQVSDQEAQYPKGYRLYSGHLDWTHLQNFRHPKFVFSVLRDPRERIASFYSCLINEARSLNPEELTHPANRGKRAILEKNADDFLFGGNDEWHNFILDQFDNFYVRYFASKQIRAGHAFSNLPSRRKLRLALRNLSDIDWIYHVDKLKNLEADLNTLFGFDLSFAENTTNTDDGSISEMGWPRLMDRIESDANKKKLEAFVELDESFMSRLEF